MPPCRTALAILLLLLLPAASALALGERVVEVSNGADLSFGLDGDTLAWNDGTFLKVMNLKDRSVRSFDAGTKFLREVRVSGNAVYFCVMGMVWRGEYGKQNPYGPEVAVSTIAGRIWYPCRLDLATGKVGSLSEHYVGEGRYSSRFVVFHGREFRYLPAAGGPETAVVEGESIDVSRRSWDLDGNLLAYVYTRPLDRGKAFLRVQDLAGGKRHELGEIGRHDPEELAFRHPYLVYPEQEGGVRGGDILFRYRVRNVETGEVFFIPRVTDRDRNRKVAMSKEGVLYYNRERLARRNPGISPGLVVFDLAKREKIPLDADGTDLAISGGTAAWKDRNAICIYRFKQTTGGK